jgi:hypothetical protein
MKSGIRRKLGLAVAVLAMAGLVGLSQEKAARAQWEASGHNNVNTSLGVSTVEARQASAAHCARCHSDQGFVAWVSQLQKGDSGFIKGPDGKDATVAHLTSLGLTSKEAKPITCTTCHDDEGDLRIVNNVSMLPSGFGVSAVGTGALCMSCHNTRNGRIDWKAEDKKSFGAPHHSSQADIIMGKNVFFVNDTSESTTSPHAAFTGDSCTTCHMSLSEEPHKYEVPRDSCSNCHGAEYKQTSVQRPTRQLLESVRVAVQARLLARAADVKVVQAYDAAKSTYSEKLINGSDIKGITAIDSTSGQIAFTLKMANGDEIITRIADIRKAKLADGKPGEQVFTTADPMVRAAYNYLMVKFDGSNGVHNPSFTREVLLASAAALK